MRQKTGYVANILLAVVVLLAGSVSATVAAAAGGTGPDDALVPSDEWQPLNVKESHWYAFEYAGDGSQIQIRLEVEPLESAVFEVWTPGEIERWGLGLEAEPIGRGSADPSAAGVLLWSGNFYDTGTYYVVVEHAEGQPGTSYYLLTVSGDGVSLPESTGATAPAPTATATPAPAKTKAAALPKSAGKLVFQTSAGGDIYIINADGSGLQRITDGMDPVWSPDGQQIAFARWRDPRGVWVADADGAGGTSGNERRVFDWSEARHPSWSADGEQIVFTRHTGGTEAREFCFRGRCFTIPAKDFWNLGIVTPGDGTFSEPLSNSEVSHTPDWSPDSEKIVYDAVQGLQVQSVDGQVSYLITSNARDTNPIWSPDGSKIAFMRHQHDHWEIYVVDADGGNVRRLTDTPARPEGTPGSSVAPAWSPDGNYIAFLTDRTGKWEMWVMDADGSSQKAMFKSALDGLALDYAYSGERAISWTE
jgi:dipeptidyl aminopeptidase/acylaminoacyl peptidase